MKNRIFYLLVVLVLGSLTIFTSCQKEEDLTINENFTPESSLVTETYGGPQAGLDSVGDRCFNIVYPITLEFPNGITKEVNSGAEFKETVNNWIRANRGRRALPKIQLPYNVELEDGTVATIATFDDLKDLLESCRPRGPRPQLDSNFCYRLVFPVTLKFPNDSTIAVNSAEDLRKALVRWRLNHPRATDHPELVFPYTVTLADGTTQTITSKADIAAIGKDCRAKHDRGPKGNGPRPCFAIVFPVTVEFPDSTTVVVKDNAEFLRVSAQWKARNPRSKGVPAIMFPYQILFRDSSLLTLENPGDLRKATADCRPDFKARCYELIFPARVKLPNGEIVIAANPAEFVVIGRRWAKQFPRSNARPEIAFPTRVKLPNGETVILANQNQLEALLQACRNRG